MTFKPQLDILPKAQKLLWPQLKPCQTMGFVLYGSTAIALRCVHRQSVYFNFYSNEPLNRESLKTAMPFLINATVLQDQGNAYSVMTSPDSLEDQPVKVSFFGALNMGRVGTPELTQDQVMYVASLDDLMATKVKVILQRAEAKDYLDIAAMIKAGVSLARGLASARLIFGLNFQPSESLKALAYFNDGDLKSLSKDLKKYLIKASGSVENLPEIKILSNHLSPINTQL